MGIRTRINSIERSELNRNGSQARKLSENRQYLSSNHKYERNHLHLPTKLGSAHTCHSKPQGKRCSQAHKELTHNRNCSHTENIELSRVQYKNTFQLTKKLYLVKIFQNVKKFNLFAKLCNKITLYKQNIKTI